MKKIILLLFIILFISCDINFDIPQTQSVSTTVIQIESANIFAIKGALYVSVRKTLPITIYNPNNYEITITIGKESMKINPLSSITIQTLTQSDREVEA